MLRFNTILKLLITATLFQALGTRAQYIIREGNTTNEVVRRSIVLPYAFSSETLGIGLGLGGTYAPGKSPQTTYYGTAYFTDNGSWRVVLGGHNVQFPKLDRLSLRPFTSFARYAQMRIYIDGNPDYAETERAGSNESSAENYIERDAHEMILELPLRYTLPMGHFKESGIHAYVTRNGILKENPSGAESINPFVSGQSVLSFRPYYRKMYDNTDEGETLFFELGLEHDNRDFIPNPHRGYRLKALARYDPSWVKRSNEWMTWEGELDTFIPLPETSWSRQQTLALSGWASYAPTYDPAAPDQSGKPPYFAGPHLGGFYRLRGYPAYRFNDKSAIHYTAEYRVMPEWQPFGDIDILDPLMIRWWQVVGLFEVGRVAPTWNLKTLHTDMKYDVGIGLRGMFHNGIGRLDLVVSEEGFSFTAMFGQAF